MLWLPLAIGGGVLFVFGLLGRRGAQAPYQGGPFAWGKQARAQLGADGYQALTEVAAALGVDPGDIATTIRHESGFKTDIVNDLSNATGLIQFIPSTARRLGTTVEALGRMGPREQLYYVYKYYEPARGKLQSVADVYSYTFGTASAGKPLEYCMYKEGSGGYANHSYLDTDRDGCISKEEATRKIVREKEQGLKAGNIG